MDNGEPIDVSGTLHHKNFDGAPGLGQVLHDDSKFSSCFARKLYSYGIGADTEDVDVSRFAAAYKVFTDSGYRLRPLLRAIATSPEFFGVPAPAAELVKSAMNN